MDTDKEFMYFSVETLQLFYGSWMGVGAGGVVYWFKNQTVLHIVHLSAYRLTFVIMTIAGFVLYTFVTRSGYGFFK